MKIFHLFFYNALKLLVHSWLREPNNNVYIEQNYNIDISSPLFTVNKGFIDIRKAKSKDYRNIIINTNLDIHAGLKYWQGEGVLDQNYVKNSFVENKRATSETSLLAFQYIIIHNIVPTNTKLKDWRDKDCDICTYCKSHIDTLEHYL